MRATIVALALALLLTVGIALTWRVLAPAAAEVTPVVVEWSTSPASRSDWQYPRETRSFDAMYAPGATVESVDRMYAKPRRRYFAR